MQHSRLDKVFPSTDVSYVEIQPAIKALK